MQELSLAGDSVIVEQRQIEVVVKKNQCFHLLIRILKLIPKLPIYTDNFQAVIIIFLMTIKQTVLQAVLCLFLLLSPTSCANWQGTGVIEKNKMDQIWLNIGINFGMAVSMGGSAAGFAKTLSDNLNTQFDQAWNVVVVQQTDPTWDTIVYGYAYKYQWMWYNGYTVGPSPTKFYSFIVWKDYNCKTWHSIGNSNFTASIGPSDMFYMSLDNAITAGFPSRSNAAYDDIWRIGFNLGDYLNHNVPGAFTVVASQAGASGTSLTPSTLYARICTADGQSGIQYRYTSYPFFSNDKTVRLLIMQTR